HGFLTSLDFAYGVLDNFQIGASIGYFIGNDFKSAELQDDGSVEEAKANPQGLTDLTITGKYRILHGAPGNLAIIVGVKFPTGRSNTLYITPGARLRFDKNWAVTLAPSFPIIQDVNGEQGEVRYKIALTLTFSN